MIKINVNGRDYLVSERPTAHDTIGHGLVVAYDYFSTRNGDRFGPIRLASTADKPKSVGGQIVAQAAQILNADHDAMIAEAARLTDEFRASGKSGSYPRVGLITS